MFRRNNILNLWDHANFSSSVTDHGPLVIDDRDEANLPAGEVEEKYKTKGLCLNILPNANLACIFQSLTNYAAYLHQPSITTLNRIRQSSLILFPKCLLATSNISVTIRASI